jgi:hypothetical protein
MVFFQDHLEEAIQHHQGNVVAEALFSMIPRKLHNGRKEERKSVYCSSPPVLRRKLHIAIAMLFRQPFPQHGRGFERSG